MFYAVLKNRRLTNSVDKQLGLGREIVVDDIIETRDVKASGSHVSHY